MSQPAFDLSFDEGHEPTYSVGELAEAINGALRRRFDDGVWVRGEIQGWSERGPHAYFRLVEHTDAGKAVLNVQFFAPQRRNLRALLMKNGLHLADGLKVRIFGQLDFYAAGGTIGLKMSGIDPRFTLGELALQRDDVIRRLAEAGLLDRNRGRSIAMAPLRVGVVTSLASAAWADFRDELDRSGYAFRVRTIDVRVQGETAVSEVGAALRTLSRHADLDVLVLIRGGGARSELATFDHHDIATAIAMSPLPVLTGLGHEIDRSVADEVAHTALKTPTACAGELVQRVQEAERAAEAAWTGVQHVATVSLQAASSRVATVTDRLHHRVLAAVERSDERLAQRRRRAAVAAAGVLDRANAHLRTAAAGVARVPQRLEPELRHLDGLAERVRLLDPVNTMARGWSITRTADGRTVRTAADLQPGDQIVTTFATGTARSRVEETQP